MMNLPKLSWLSSRPALILRAAVALALAYALVSLAIDSGSWLHYFLTFVSVLLSIKFLIRAVIGSGKQ